MITYNVSKYPTSNTHYFEGHCLSSDTKPTGSNVANGSCLIEMDTSKLYFYDAANAEWKEWGEEDA